MTVAGRVPPVQLRPVVRVGAASASPSTAVTWDGGGAGRQERTAAGPPVSGHLLVLAARLLCASVRTSVSWPAYTCTVTLSVEDASPARRR